MKQLNLKEFFEAYPDDFHVIGVCECGFNMWSHRTRCPCGRAYPK